MAHRAHAHITLAPRSTWEITPAVVPIACRAGVVAVRCHCHDVVVMAASAGVAGAGAVAAEQLRGGPAVDSIMHPLRLPGLTRLSSAMSMGPPAEGCCQGDGTTPVAS